jgi:7-cyano-7-deazaguanine synthase
MADEVACALVSGGLDSAVMVALMVDQGVTVQPVYVRTGMMWEVVEYAWLERFLSAIATPRLRPVVPLAFPLADVYASHWSVGGPGVPGFEAPDEAVYLPGRNIILVAKTAVFCALNGINRIALGVLSANPFPDASDAFFAQMSDSLSRGLAHSIQIDRPLQRMKKTDVVGAGAHLPLALTFSCIRPRGETHCGDCNKCAERQRGFAEANVPDPTQYATRRVTPSASAPETGAL